MAFDLELAERITALLAIADGRVDPAASESLVAQAHVERGVTYARSLPAKGSTER